MSMLNVWQARRRRLVAYWLGLALLAILFAACEDNPTPPAASPTTAPVAETAATTVPATAAASDSAAVGAVTADATTAPAATDTPAPAPTPTPDTDRGELVLWHSWAGADGDALSQMLSSFQAANPDVELQTLFVAYNELPQAYADAVYAGGGPDLILAPTWWLHQLAEAGTLLPLDDLVGAETLSTTYMPAALANLSYNQQTYGLPISFDLVSLYYNRNLIDDASLPTTTATC
ncbi:MAG: extracellular solute-binding protein [Caldilineaceae bacterium]